MDYYANFPNNFQKIYFQIQRLALPLLARALKEIQASSALTTQLITLCQTLVILTPGASFRPKVILQTYNAIQAFSWSTSINTINDDDEESLTNSNSRKNVDSASAA